MQSLRAALDGQVPSYFRACLRGERAVLQTERSGATPDLSTQLRETVEVSMHSGLLVIQRSSAMRLRSRHDVS